VATRLAELYWNLQAQTWRQEFTEVAMGHSPAAEAFYQAIDSFERVTAGRQATPEGRRQLGALCRWNNDAASALALHDALLKASAPGEPLHGQLLSELARTGFSGSPGSGAMTVHGWSKVEAPSRIWRTRSSPKCFSDQKATRPWPPNIPTSPVGCWTVDERTREGLIN
jgi:hypothetical protein